MSTDNKQKLNEVIAEVKKGLQMDGGDMELLSFEDGVVLLKFKGACVGCPLAAVTFKDFIEKQILEQVSEVKEVKISE